MLLKIWNFIHSCAETDEYDYKSLKYLCLTDTKIIKKS